MITLSNWFASSIRVKVLIGFTAVVALFLMMAGVGYFQLNQVRRSSQKVVLLSQQMAQSHEFALAISSLNSNLEQYMVIGGSQIEGKLFKDIDRMTATVARLKKLELDSTSPTVADLDRLTEVLKTEMTTLVKMDANGALSGEIDRQLLSVYGQIDQTEELHHRLAGETLRDLQRITAIQESTLIRVLNQLLVLAPLTLIFAIGASVLMAQGIVNPLSKLTEVATRIAGGELETRAPVTGRDETARLAISFNSMTEQLNGLIRNLEQKVSDLKRTETALRESEERCRSLFEGTPVGIYRITPSGQFLDVNPTLVDILGYPDRETLLAQNVDNLYVQAVVHKEWQALVEREGVVRGFEAEWRRHDGSVIWVKNTGRVVRDDNGQVLYYEGSLDDITEWMQAEKSLRESEEKYRQLFELESDAVFLIDNETGRILEANTAASTMYGYTREELLSKKNSDLSAEPEETRRVTQATPIIEDQIVFIPLRYHRKRDGTVIAVEITGRFFVWRERSVHIAAIRDISARKQAQEAMQQSEARLKAIFDNAVVGIGVVDTKGHYIQVNERWSDMLGYQVDEIYEVSHLNVTHPDDMAASRDHLEALARRDIDAYRLEKRFVRKDGTVFWGDLSVSPIVDQAGKVEAIVGMIIDITERKQAEGALRDSEATNRAILEAIPDAIFELDKDGTFLNFIPTKDFEPLLPPNEFLGRKLVEVLPPELGCQLQNCLEQAVQTGELQFYEYPLAMEGQTKYYEARYVRISSDKVLSIVRNITMRQEMERREQLAYELGQQLTTLLEPETLLQELVNRLGKTFGYYHAHIYLYDQKETQLVVRAGMGAAGESMRQSRHAIPLKAERSLVARAANLLEPVVVKDVSQDSYHLPNPLLPETRSEVALPLHVGQHLIGVLDVQHSRLGHFNEEEVRTLQILTSQLAVALSNARHFEEIRQLNLELEDRVAARTAQLAAANKELEAFAYSISHDLRAPLRGINGFSQVLLEDYHHLLDATGQDHLHRIRAASQRMGQLIDDLLQLSRLMRVEIVHEPVDLSSLAREIAENLRHTQPDRQAEFVIKSGVKVTGDERLLRVVLENLLHNAWKFTGKQEQAAIEFGETKIDGQTVYFVRDNGAGFDMAYADKLFGAFQRLHAATEFEGTGIGLATVQRIILRHGGRVWAEGAVNRGATFYFKLGERSVYDRV